MPGAGRAEIYFIVAMMIVILIMSVAAVYFFVKTYKKEMSEKKARKLETPKLPDEADKME